MDKGIFVDGVPLGDYVGIEKDIETKDEFNSTVANITKSLWKPVIPPKESRYIKHSRAKRLSPDQIRKEYGIMAQPLEPFWMNLLYLLEKEGPQLPKDLLTLTNLQKKQSGLISGSMHKLQKKVPEYVKRTDNGKWEIKDATAEEIIKLYNSRKGKKKPLTIKMPNPAFTTPQEARVAALKTMAENVRPAEIQPDFVKTVVQEAIETVIKQLGIKVKIEGTIKILFGFDKNV